MCLNESFSNVSITITEAVAQNELMKTQFKYSVDATDDTLSGVIFRVSIMTNNVTLASKTLK